MKARSTRSRRATTEAKARAPALTKEKWVDEFVTELVTLRAELHWPSKSAQTLAISEWSQHRDIDPREAARRWCNKPS